MTPYVNWLKGHFLLNASLRVKVRANYVGNSGKKP